jgi:hypothetical protein
LGTGTVYVGTDVGVFASSTGTASWTEVGSASTQAGFLPNVAVTSLKIFNSGGLKRLRAATYGRGIWESNLITTSDFQLSVTNNPLTIFAGHTATYNGTISAINGYNGTVNLSCTAGSTGIPQSCSTNPAALVPVLAGTGFSLNASDAAGDYAFNLHAVGNDLATVTHDFPLTLHVVDFSLGTPSPSSVSVVPGNVSSPVSLLISALGAFSGSVTLSCSGLPSGATCHFQPSAVTPVIGTPATETLTVSTSVSTPLGTSQITINASSPGGISKTQTLTLTVSSAPDFGLAIANPSLTAHVNSSAVFNGTLTSLNGYSSVVSLGCGIGAPPSCVVSPTSATPTNPGTLFTATVSSSVSQTYSFNVTGVGSDPAAISHSAAVSFTAMPAQGFDFTMGITPTSGSAPAGQSASFSLSVAPTTGTFPSNVSFACSNLPAMTACTFNPAQVGAGSGNSTIGLTISTTAPISHAAAMAVFAAFPLGSLFWLLPLRSSSKRRLVAAATLLLLGTFLSCGGGLQGNSAVGGGGSPGTPLGTYNVKVTANAGFVAHSTQVSLTVSP